MAPPRLRECVASAAIAVKNAARRRFLRSLEQAARLRLQVAAATASVDAERELRALLQHLCQRDMKYVPVELWSSWFVTQAPLPEYQSLCLAVDFVSSAVTRQHEAETRCRLSSWRETCRARCRDPKQKRHTFSWVRYFRAPPLVSVKLPDSGAVSFEATDVERVLCSKWQPVACPSEGEAPSMDFDVFGAGFVNMLSLRRLPCRGLQPLTSAMPSAPCPTPRLVVLMVGLSVNSKAGLTSFCRSLLTFLMTSKTREGAGLRICFSRLWLWSQGLY